MDKRGWIREIKRLVVGVRGLLAVLATAITQLGCTVEEAQTDYLYEVLPSGWKAELVENCGGSFGLSAAVAVFEVTVPEDSTVQDLTEFEPVRGVWTRQASLQEFVEQYDSGVGIAATVLDGKDCLRDLRDDAATLLFEPAAGLYFRSNGQDVVIIMPDADIGTAILLAQGR